MKYTIGKEFPAWLLTQKGQPCISLYQPTHRHLPQNQQDPIRFRNLIKTVEESMMQKFSRKETQPLVDSLLSIAEDRSFWNMTLDGLAVLRSPETFLIYHLQRTVPEVAIVAETFHTKPLMRIFQSADRYQILCLNRKEVKMMEGNRDALDEITLAEGVPKTIKDALGDELTDSHLTVASYGGVGKGMFHGQGGKKDEVKGDTERFFRAVDRAVWEYHSRPTGLPLLIAALPEYHSIFREVSHNPNLLDEGIKHNPDALDLEGLRRMAWEVMGPQYSKRLSGLVDNYHAALNKGLATDRLEDIGQAAIQGQISVLLVEADRHLPGILSRETGRVEPHDLSNPEVDDVLDDLAEMVISTKGEVVVVPKEQMPSTTGLSATLRF